MRVEIPLDAGEKDSRVYIVGSGYRVEEQSRGSDGGGGGCAVGGSDSGGAFGLFPAALVLLLTVLLKGCSSEDRTYVLRRGGSVVAGKR